MFAVAFLIGCRPTPDEEIVIRKDTERLVETVAAQNPDNSDIYSPIEPVAERFTYDYTSTNGRLKVHADADVKVPDSGKIPMTHVNVTSFSDAFAKQVFDYVYQGKTVYMRTATPRTKAMISEELKKYQEIANNGTWEENGFVDAQEVDEYIEQLKELYPDAPDELEPIKWSLPTVPWSLKAFTGQTRISWRLRMRRRIWRSEEMSFRIETTR